MAPNEPPSFKVVCKVRDISLMLSPPLSVCVVLLSPECQKQRRDLCYVGPSGQPTQPDDPLIVTKALRHPAFSVGQLVLRPLREKGTQYVKNDSMVGAAESRSLGE